MEDGATGWNAMLRKQILVVILCDTSVEYAEICSYMYMRKVSLDQLPIFDGVGVNSL